MKTCFGCCPLSHGVSAIALINIVWNITEVFKHIYHRTEEYNRYKLVHVSNGNTSVSSDDNSTAEYESHHDFWSDIETIPVMSGIYMDYIFIISVGWIVLEFISNFCLKQSTFKCAPQKIYVWLVIYYGNLLFMILHLVHYTILMMRHPILFNSLFKMTKQHFGHFYTKCIYIAIISLEIAIIHSFYISEKKIC